MKLIIELDDKTNKVSIRPEGNIKIDDALGLMFTAQLEVLRHFLVQAKRTGATPEALQVLKEDLYDKYNAGASNVLYLFAPDTELRPDLTVEAMKEAEDRYMYNQLNRRSRREIDAKTKGATRALRDKEG